MLQCLLWSGPVCIIFWSEWCHCDSVVMVIYAFIVSSHRSEGCRRITHPLDCCSGPLNPPSVTPKLHHKLRFFFLLLKTAGWRRILPREKEQLESAIFPLHRRLYGWCSSISTLLSKHYFLLPSARHDGSRTPLLLHRHCPFGSLEQSWWGEQGGDRGREGGAVGIGWWLP